MRPRTLLLLALLVAGLLAFIWFYEKDLPSSERRAELARRVLAVDADGVERLMIERGGERVALERRRASDGESEGVAGIPGEEGWRLVEPLEAPADEVEVERLVESLAELEKERTLEAFEPAAVGLDPPRAVVVLGGPESETRLLVGGAVPASSTLIVALDGRAEAYVVADSIWDELSRPAGDWRRRELFPWRRDEIERIALEGGDRRLLLGRRGGEFWLEAPLEDRADEALVSGLLSEVTGLRAEGFVDATDPDAASLGLAPAGRVLEVVVRGRERPFRLELGGPAGEPGEGALGDRAYASADGRLVELHTRLGEAFDRPAEAWRSRDWSSREVYRIDRLRIRDGAGEISLIRVDGDWRRGEERIPAAPVRELLYAVTGVVAEELLEAGVAAAAGARLDEPELEIVLGGEDGEEILSLYPPIEAGRPAEVSGRETVLMLPAGAVGDLLLKLEEVRAAAPLAADDDAPPEG